MSKNSQKARVVTNLAASHARLKASADMLRWSCNASLNPHVSQEEILATVAMIEGWATVAFRAMVAEAER